MRIQNLIRNQRLLLQESAVEVILRGSQSVLLVLGTFFFSKNELGTYNLAASIAALLGGMLGGGWIFRISLDGIRKIDSRSALIQIFLIYFLINSIMNAVLVFFETSNHWLMAISLNALLLNYALAAIHEIIWSHKSLKGDLLHYSTSRWRIILFTSLIYLLIFLVSRNIVFLALLQPLVNLIVILRFSSTIFAILSGNSEKEALFRIFPTLNQWLATIKLGALGVLSMLTFVLDNILIAFKFDINYLPAYAVAFAVISISIGVIGTPIQRIFSLKEPRVSDTSLFLKVSLLISLFCLCTTSAITVMAFLFENAILKEALPICIFLFPYAVGRILSMMLLVRVGQSGRLAFQLKSNLMYLLLVALGIMIMPSSFALIGVAAVVSTASLTSSFYLYRALSRFNSTILKLGVTN